MGSWVVALLLALGFGWCPVAEASRPRRAFASVPAALPQRGPSARGGAGFVDGAPWASLRPIVVDQRVTHRGVVIGRSSARAARLEKLRARKRAGNRRGAVTEKPLIWQHAEAKGWRAWERARPGVVGAGGLPLVLSNRPPPAGSQDGRAGAAASLGETAAARDAQLGGRHKAAHAAGTWRSAEDATGTPEDTAATLPENNRLAILSPATRRELEEVLPSLQRLNEMYDAREREDRGLWGQLWITLSALAGGTGARFGKSGFFVNKDLARRVQLQDQAVLFLLLIVYYLTLAFSCSLAHRQSKNNSRVTFYADQRFHSAAIENHDADSFLETFNQPAKNVYLKVTGYSLSPSVAPGSITWGDNSYFVDFNFALDLSSWVVRDAHEGAHRISGDFARSDSGILGADLLDLRRHLARGTSGSDLTIIAVHKEIRWTSWEELATNIRQQLRHRGYTGAIGIERTESDVVHIYRNTQWANFMHSKALKVILALSVFGWIVYLPYMWLRCNTLRIRAAHCVAIDIDVYWRLIADHLNAEGFNPSPGSDYNADSSTPLESTLAT
mmetsp:Transcript_44531/g.129487  ORF Transcript_44531/g.129487 Transcript_44531/m.129487 type:complete len:558 (+) Transcript_44531:59-1732(+)